MNIKDIILKNYKNNKNNIEDYYKYFKNYNIKILALNTSLRSGILKAQRRKIYFYILNDNIDIEYMYM